MAPFLLPNLISLVSLDLRLPASNLAQVGSCARSQLRQWPNPSVSHRLWLLLGDQRPELLYELGRSSQSRFANHPARLSQHYQARKDRSQDRKDDRSLAKRCPHLRFESQPSQGGPQDILLSNWQGGRHLSRRPACSR